MKLITLNCPRCGADLNVEAGRKYIFCEYCGQKIYIDDEVQRSEHTENINYTYRNIDEAKIREADARIKEAELQERKDLRKEKRIAAKKKGRRFFLLIILLLVLFVILRGKIGGIKEDFYVRSIGKSVKRVCDNHNAVIDEIDVFSNNINVDIVAASSLKEDIDTIQNEIADAINVPKDYEVCLSFEHPEHTRVRRTTINEYGKVDVRSDTTNSISEEDASKKVETIKKELSNKLADTPCSLKYVTYEGDVIYIALNSKTREREKIDDVIKTIMEIQKTLGEPDISILIYDSDGDTLKTVHISADSGEDVYTDDCNSITDDEAEAIEKKYRDELKPVCKTLNSELTDIKVLGDTLQITIESGDDYNKETADKIDSSLEQVLSDLSMPLNVEIRRKGGIGRVREWSMDKNGLKKVEWDVSK